MIRKENMVNRNTLSDITRGMQHCVNSTVEMMELQYQKRLLEHFNEDGTAKYINLHIDGENGLRVPTICLAQLGGLALDEITVRMQVKVNGTTIKSNHHQLNDDDVIERTSFEVSLSSGNREKNCDIIDLEMKFRSGDSPEGVARVLETYLNNILPMTADE